MNHVPTKYTIHTSLLIPIYWIWHINVLKYNYRYVPITTYIRVKNRKIISPRS